MTTRRTGLPRGQPRIPLKDHPFKLVLACIDAMQKAWNIPRQKATLLTTAIFFAKDAEPIAAADLPEKLRRVFDEHGGFPMAYTLPNPETRKAKECMQSIDTLNKMDARYSKGADLGYRTALSTLVYLTMFVRGREDERRAMVDALLHQLNDPDPQIQELAGLQNRLHLANSTTGGLPEYFPVFFPCNL